MIGGIGIDLVEVARIEKILAKWGDLFIRRVYSDSERQYCNSRSNSGQHYAVRFAAKEAFLKCLGLGIGSGIGLNRIEVVVDRRGKPRLLLHSEAREAADNIEAVAVHVSLTHTREYASAVVILER